tara:strand:+ start:139 stop:273 length:135 start_codon:yes stop_codon:yes gene_type:complete
MLDRVFEFAGIINNCKQIIAFNINLNVVDIEKLIIDNSPFLLLA